MATLGDENSAQQDEKYISRVNDYRYATKDMEAPQTARVLGEHGQERWRVVQEGGVRRDSPIPMCSSTATSPTGTAHSNLSLCQNDPIRESVSGRFYYLTGIIDSFGRTMDRWMLVYLAKASYNIFRSNQ